MTRNTLSSDVVKWQASCGGNGPDAASRRRRSIDRCLSGDRCRRLGVARGALELVADIESSGVPVPQSCQSRLFVNDINKRAIPGRHRATMAVAVLFGEQESAEQFNCIVCLRF
jgi:hypothetical protein